MQAARPVPMPFTSSHRAAAQRRARTAFAVLLLVALCALTALLGDNRADASIAAKRDALASVQDHKADVAAEIAASNGRINALIGQVSDARQRESAAATELADAEAELTAAGDELAAGREHLQEVRAQLERAIAELERVIVGVYKSDDPSLVKLLLESTKWEDATVDATYLERVHDYQADTVKRVDDLRAEAADTVDQLADAKQRISDQRDAIAERRAQLADVRAGLEAQEAELAAARQSRKDTLSRLAGRQVDLQDGIESAQRRQAREAAAAVPPPIEEAPASPAVAAPASGSQPAPSGPGGTATLNSDGSATPPAGAPPQVVAVIEAANEIRDKPYLWGGGHGSFESAGYDCSGAMSYAFHAGGFLSSPLDSTGFTYWGEAGAGKWITAYGNSGHAYAVIAGLRWDTSGTGGSGPSWSTETTSFQDPSAFTARHPAGF